MSTNSIRIKSKSEYIIEVNDRGETISFDLNDIGLPAKLLNTYVKLNELADKWQKEEKEILSRIDEKINDFVTKNQMDVINLNEVYYDKSREILDLFLGKGACQKIFGDRNYTDMFDDLLEQLEPHFKTMNLNLKDMQKKLVKKYNPSVQNVLR